MRLVIILLSVFFVLFSFSPTLVEISQRHLVPQNRVFLLEHNYLFDYNFYLSRIREGYEGRWQVTEKYYNQPHPPSLMQVVYLYLGKVGVFLQITPTDVYNLSRIFFGFLLLLATGIYCLKVLPGRWGLVAFVLVVTAGSWPIPMTINGSPRFGTYMGWWSVIDSLQRITHLPHVLIGQLMFLWCIKTFSQSTQRGLKRILWGIIGFAAGIIFPPTLVVLYTWFGLHSILELLSILSNNQKQKKMKVWVKDSIVPRAIFTVLSAPSLFYMQYMFTILPWSALALFDIQHRIPLPYREYALALGPSLPLGLVGLALAFERVEKKLTPLISWILAVGLLFLVFERVPQQSPLRFTEAALHIPLGILAAFLFRQLWHWATRLKVSIVSWGIRGMEAIVIAGVILLGVSVMVSMVGWLTDQVVARREGSWLVPIGAQVIYPLKDFMDAIYFVRDNVPRNSVVLTYITAGNYIPAYAGQYVYIGHANTPDEDTKEGIARQFFAGEMSPTIANAFLQREHVSYIFFGPQEKEIGKRTELTSVYPYLSKLYENPQVILYRYK